MTQNQNQLENNFVLIGQIVNTHGVRGDLKVMPEPGNFEINLKKVKTIYYYSKGKFIELNFNNVRMHKNTFLIKPEQYNNINDVEFLKGELVYIEFEYLKDDQYFYHELIGYKVISNNELLDVVDNFFLQGFYYALKLKNEKQITIPINDKFIKNIDKERKEITVKFPEGYIDDEKI